MTEQPTLQKTIQMAADHHDAVSAEIKTPEVRVYETKTSRVLANGEIREYTIKQHYVVKKKHGICKTELKKREAKLRSEITGALHNLEIPQLLQLRELAQELNDRPFVPGDPLDALRQFPEHLPPNKYSIKYQNSLQNLNPSAPGSPSSGTPDKATASAHSLNETQAILPQTPNPAE